MQHTVTQDGEITVIALKGDIDLEFSSSMRKVLLDSIAKSRGVAVDLSAVSMIDSSGVASLLEAFQTARKRGKKMILAAPPDAVLRVLKLARLDTVFQMADDVASAKRALA
ncbi:MAG: STAS domain-containing protein [Rhodospirillales bacterium]